MARSKHLAGKLAKSLPPRREKSSGKSKKILSTKKLAAVATKTDDSPKKRRKSRYLKAVRLIKQEQASTKSALVRAPITRFLRRTLAEKNFEETRMSENSISCLSHYSESHMLKVMRELALYMRSTSRKTLRKKDFLVVVNMRNNALCRAPFNPDQATQSENLARPPPSSSKKGPTAPQPTKKKKKSKAAAEGTPKLRDESSKEIAQEDVTDEDFLKI